VKTLGNLDRPLWQSAITADAALRRHPPAPWAGDSCHRLRPARADAVALCPPLRHSFSCRNV